MQINILCYGDSNTWGYVSARYSQSNFLIKRYNRDKRWPGILQKKLGKKYYVIEEGLNGRTTNLNYPIYPDRNGKTYLPSCLYSHAPIDRHNYIFEPFTKIESPETSRYSGIGLRLSNVNLMLKKMGGNITVDSEINKGSVFTVYLPV